MMHWFGNYEYGMGHGYNWLFMILFWIFLILLLLYLLKFIVKGNKDQEKNTPLEILRERYAKGEIDKDEFDRMKKDLLE